MVAMAVLRGRKSHVWLVAILIGEIGARLDLRGFTAARAARYQARDRVAAGDKMCEKDPTSRPLCLEFQRWMSIYARLTGARTVEIPATLPAWNCRLTWWPDVDGEKQKAAFAP
jgi:hypothetical protein